MRLLAAGLVCIGVAACSGNDSGSPGATGQTTQQVFTIDPFEVDPGGETYKCQDMPNPIGKDVAILKADSVFSAGSHHMFAFKIDAKDANLAADGSKGPIVDCPNGGLEIHPYISLSQTQHQITTYPEGVGRSLKGTDVIRMMVHYLNTTSGPLQANAQVTVDYVDADKVTSLAAEMFLFAGNLSVPPGMSTHSYSQVMPADVKILQATGHMHSRGTHFVANAVSATGALPRQIWASDTWDEPPSTDYTPGFAIPGGDSVQFTCTYQNATSKTLSLGESAATNEMCLFFGVYYPAPGGVGLITVLPSLP
ncbi:MAG TPA: hypothetical protein VH062_14355 [Polyangiaceae bacterium]|jgi:hypothetical protein|nr:hypothetical protein [Polyangiaceae bacterium]